ncbi:MAG: hypothetical protein J6Y16_11305, partial [Treponema sp.]|nr:hypothetical protein [Treponema sp.]
MPIIGWILGTLIAIIITGAITSIVFFISISIDSDNEILDSIFTFIYSGIASVISLLIFGWDVSLHTGRVILSIYGTVFLFIFIQYLLRYLLDNVFYIGDEILTIVGVILSIVFSISLIVFAVNYIPKTQEKTKQKIEETALLDNSYKTISNDNQELTINKLENQRGNEEEIIKRAKFSTKNKVLILCVTLSILIAVIAIIIFSWIKKEERTEERLKYNEKQRQKAIHEAADIIARKLGNYHLLDNAIQFLKDYETEKKKINREIKQFEKYYQDEESQNSLFNFGHSSRLAEYARNISNSKKRMTTFTRKNDPSLTEFNSILGTAGKDAVDTYKKYTKEVQCEIDKIIQAEKVKQEQAVKQARDSAYEAQKKESLERSESLKRQQNENDIKRKIDLLENFIPVIQNNFSEIKKLDFNILNQVEQYLDTVADSKNYIPEESINNLERCKMKLLPLFERS